MGWQYNENLFEGLAVMATAGNLTLTSTGTGTSVVGPFNTKTLRRVIFDINVLGAAAATATFTAQLQMNTTSASTGFTAVPTGTTFGFVQAIPTLNAQTSGAIYYTYNTAGTSTYTSTTTGTTAAQFYRFEYKVETLRASIDNATGSGPTTTSNASTWLQLVLTGSTSAATVSAVAYGVCGSYPAADINLNQFTPPPTTTFSASSGFPNIPVAFAQQTFIDGYLVNNVPYTTTALGQMSKILPI